MEVKDLISRAIEKVKSIFNAQSIEEITIQRQYLLEIFDNNLLEISKKDGLPVLKPRVEEVFIRNGIITEFYEKTVKIHSKYKSKFKIHRSITNDYEKNLWSALPNLQLLQKRLGITDAIAEDALRIYTQIVKEELTMGRSIDTLLSASIFSALRVHGMPRTAKEIAKVAQIPKKKVIKCYILILMEILPKLGMKVQHSSTDRYIHELNNV